ncbi:MAG: peptidoglycan DD-metalloendopeptidase family protein [Pseudomonadota bacterium]
MLLSQQLCWADKSLENNQQARVNKQQLDSLQLQIKQLQKNLNKITQSKNSELLLLKKTDLQINQLVQQIFQLDKKIKQLESRYQKLSKSIQYNQQQLQLHQQILSQQLTARYHIGQQEFVKLLLNQQNPAVFSRIMSYYQYFHQARLDQIEQVNLIITQLDDQRAQLQLLQQEIELQQYLKNNEKSSLDTQQQQRNQLIAQLSSQQQDGASKLKQLQQNEQQLKNLLAALKQAIEKAAIIRQKEQQAKLKKKKSQKPFKKLKGKLKWPLKGKLKKLYGHWRSMGKVRWKGNIIHSAEGKNVYSIAYGTVVYSDWLRGYGLLTIIEHGKGYMSLYGYSQALLKSVGDIVEQGEVIATAGRTSGRRKAGIYFEIRYNGKATNPNRWCSSMPK